MLVAMEKGTVIFNSADAHIPKSASLCLACCDGTDLPNVVNLYLTKAQQRTSASPHTDRQDVVVVQMTGTKRWRVYAPPNPSHKSQSDPFARGTDEEASLHLTFNFDSHVWDLDYLSLRKYALMRANVEDT